MSIVLQNNFSKIFIKPFIVLFLENLDEKGNLEIKSNFIISKPFSSSIIFNPAGEKKLRCSGGIIKISRLPKIYLKKELKLGTAIQIIPLVSNNLNAFLIHSAGLICMFKNLAH